MQKKSPQKKSKPKMEETLYDMKDLMVLFFLFITVASLLLWVNNTIEVGVLLYAGWVALGSAALVLMRILYRYFKRQY